MLLAASRRYIRLLTLSTDFDFRLAGFNSRSSITSQDCNSVVETTDRGRTPGCRGEHRRRFHLRAHRAGSELAWRKSGDTSACDAARVRLTEVEIDSIDVGEQQKHIGADLAGKLSAGAVLVDDRLDPDETAIAALMPPPPAQMTTTPASTRIEMTFISRISSGSGDATTLRHLLPSRANVQPRSASIRRAAASS